MSEIIPLVQGQPNLLDFRDGVYRAGCVNCGHAIQWEFDSDPDSPVYYASCCGHQYRMRIHQVSITVNT